MKDMIKYLPGYYRKSQVVADLFAAQLARFKKSEAAISSEDLDVFIATTSDFSRHETDVGLSSIIADVETKRARVIARLRGWGVLTVDALKDLITEYDATGCTIYEDYANYTITIFFSGRTGIPYNIEEIKAAVDEVIPAHIAVLYQYNINTWGDAKAKFVTWGAASAYTWAGAAYYDGRVWLYVDSDGAVYECEDGANAYLVYVDGIPYARLL